MASPKFSFCILLLFVSYGILTPTCCLGEICKPKENAALFVFGDSIFDVGNNNYINTTADNHANLGLVTLMITYAGKAGLNNVSQVENFSGSNNLYPGDFIPFTRKPLFLIIDSDNSHAFKAAFCQMIGLSPNESDTDVYNEAENIIANALTEWEIILCSSTTMDLVWAQEIHKVGGRKFGVLNMPAMGCVPFVKILVNASKGFKEGGVACCGSGPYRGNFSCGGKGAEKDYDLCENPSEYVLFPFVLSPRQ
ncbi:GDSL esterase/lipase 5 [Glycine soja]